MILDKPIKMQIFPDPNTISINGWYYDYDNLKEEIKKFNNNKTNNDILIPYGKPENLAISLSNIMCKSTLIYEEDRKFYVDITHFINTHYTYGLFDYDIFNTTYAIGSIMLGVVLDTKSTISSFEGLFIDFKEGIMNKYALRKVKINSIISGSTD